MTPNEAKQLNAHLIAAFRTIGHLHAVTAAVMYQQMALVAGFGDKWVEDQLAQLAATLESRASEVALPQFAHVAVQMVRQISRELESGRSAVKVSRSALDADGQALTEEPTPPEKDSAS